MVSPIETWIKISWNLPEAFSLVGRMWKTGEGHGEKGKQFGWMDATG